MSQKNRVLPELPYAEIVKSGTIRLVSVKDLRTPIRIFYFIETIIISLFFCDFYKYR